MDIDCIHGSRVTTAFCQICGTVRVFSNSKTNKFPDSGYWTKCRACNAWRIFFRIVRNRVVSEGYYATPEGREQMIRQSQ